MTAPGPVSGSNPWGLTYQSRQYDTRVPPEYTVFDALAQPPASGISAEASPATVAAENANPPVGAGGNEPSGGAVRPTNPYAQSGDNSYES